MFIYIIQKIKIYELEERNKKIKYYRDEIKKKVFKLRL